MNPLPIALAALVSAGFPPVAPHGAEGLSSYQPMPLPTAYDALFNRYRESIPLNFMKALTQRESNFNPKNASGPAWGLMQITEVVRHSYNKRHGTSYSRADLLNPAINVKMAADLLKRIVTAYAKHPAANMKTSWSNPEFVKLVLAGWNSGYSEGGGVGKVARYLHDRGLPVTHDNVFQYANAAKATYQLQRDEKRRWQAGVASLYFSEGGAGSSLFLNLAVAVGAAAIAYKFIERRRG
jgi:soluble lytic murein transglycosylase-like protein